MGFETTLTAGCRVAALIGALAATAAPPGAAESRRAVPEDGGASGDLRIVKIASGAGAFHVLSTLIVGPTESLLFDAQYKVSDGRRLAREIAATGTRLEAVVLSHADHDHYMGAMAVLESFPGTPVYMTRAGLDDFRERAPGDFARERRRGDDPEVPDALVTPELLPSTTLLVDGHPIEVIDGLVGDVRAPVSAALWIPELETLLAGDLVFQGVHPWLGDASRDSRAAWRESLRRLAALEPVAVVPGHERDASAGDAPGQIDFMIDYLNAYDGFMATASTAEDVAAAMVEAYPELSLPGLMAYGARTWFGK